MLQSVCEVFFTRFALIEICSYPGVNDEFTYREFVKDINEVIELLRILIAEPCFK